MKKILHKHFVVCAKMAIFAMVKFLYSIRVVFGTYPLHDLQLKDYGKGKGKNGIQE